MQSVCEHVEENFSLSLFERLSLVSNCARLLDNLDGRIHGNLNQASFSLPLDFPTPQNLQLNRLCLGINPRWQAPELSLAGTSKFSAAVDVFAFGMLSFHILTGYRAFDFESSDLTVTLWVLNGHRPLFPPVLDEIRARDAPLADAIWMLLCDCVQQDPLLRPSFKTIRSRLIGLFSISKSPAAIASPPITPPSRRPDNAPFDSDRVLDHHALVDGARVPDHHALVDSARPAMPDFTSKSLPSSISVNTERSSPLALFESPFSPLGFSDPEPLPSPAATLVFPKLDYVDEKTAPVVPKLDYIDEKTAPVVPKLDYMDEKTAPVVPKLDYMDEKTAPVVPKLDYLDEKTASAPEEKSPCKVPGAESFSDPAHRHSKAHIDLGDSPPRKGVLKQASSINRPKSMTYHPPPSAAMDTLQKDVQPIQATQTLRDPQLYIDTQSLRESQTRRRSMSRITLDRESLTAVVSPKLDFPTPVRRPPSYTASTASLHSLSTSTNTPRTLSKRMSLSLFDTQRFSIPRKPSIDASRTSLSRKPSIDASRSFLSRKPSIDASRFSFPQNPGIDASRSFLSRKPSIDASRFSFPRKPSIDTPRLFEPGRRRSTSSHLDRNAARRLSSVLDENIPPVPPLPTAPPPMSLAGGRNSYARQPHGRCADVDIVFQGKIEMTYPDFISSLLAMYPGVLYQDAMFVRQ
ncbi:MAG: hypothetical protein SGCHY_002306, partial [Lobulomycetales sp.]